MTATREEWLTEAVKLINHAIFDDEMPSAWVVTCGQYFSKNQDVLGTCVPADHSSVDAVNIFISPVLQDPMDVLGTLVHEMIHAVVGCDQKHGGDFKKMVKELGMSMPAKTALPVPGTPLYATLTRFAVELGPYPHGALIPVEKPKRASALMGFVSPQDEEFTVTASMEKVSQYGFPLDPWGNKMVPKDQERFDEFLAAKGE